MIVLLMFLYEWVTYKSDAEVNMEYNFDPKIGETPSSTICTHSQNWYKIVSTHILIQH